MNAYVRNKIAKKQGENATRSEALSILEELRQESTVGTEDLAMIERNRRLINGTIGDIPTAVAPYNTVKGSEVQGLGINGAFKPDSDVRIHTEYADTNDPLLDDDVRQFGLRETGVQTEYLSPGGAQELYRQWAPTQHKDQRTADHFNRAVAEYYGQQALKLAGNKPVADRDRSYNVREDRGRNRNTTLGTDRLIETNATMTGGDVGRPAADYRYQTPAGDIRVGDMQVATYERNPAEAGVRLQALKNSKMRFAQEKAFAENLQVAAKQAQDIDEALEIMHQRGQLPALSRGEIKRWQTDKPDGMRAGKMTSDAPFMGSENFNDQHRYQHVLYALQPKRVQQETLGAAPTNYIDVDTGAARVFMNENAERLKLMTNMGSRDGSAILHTDVRELINAGVATDLISRSPAIAQLLNQ